MNQASSQARHSTISQRQAFRHQSRIGIHHENGYHSRMSIEQIQQKLTKHGFESRPSQLAMMQHVHEAFLHKHILCIEAPTGTGKTLSYVIGALLARRKGQTLVISTATIALQEQLLSKDLPMIKKILGKDFRFSIAKGRRRYVCLSRLYDHDNEQADMWRDDTMLDKIQNQWESGRWQGDREQLSFHVPDPIWHHLTVDAAACSNQLCDFYESCAFFKARKKMFASDVVVTNHNLLLSDLSLGGGMVLPDPDDSLYVIDECHHLVDKALDHQARVAPVMGVADLINAVNRLSQRALQMQWLTQNDAQQLTRATQALMTHVRNCHEWLWQHSDLFVESVWQVDSVNEPSSNIQDTLLANANAISEEAKHVAALWEQLCRELEKQLNLNTLDEKSKQTLANSYAQIKYLNTPVQNLYLTWESFCRKRQPKEAPIARWFSRHHEKIGNRAFA